jgi:hypothetical protein
MEELMQKWIEQFRLFVMPQDIDKLPVGLFSCKMRLCIYFFHQTKTAVWGILTDSATELKTYKAAWDTASASQDQYKQDQTSAKVTAKNNASTAYHKFLRTFVTQWPPVNPKYRMPTATAWDNYTYEYTNTGFRTQDCSGRGGLIFPFSCNICLWYHDQNPAHSNARSEGDWDAKFMLKWMAMCRHR